MDVPEKAAWKKYLGIGIQVLMDFKVLGLIVLNVLMVYMGVWDTVMRPNLEQMQGRDKALEEQKKALQEKEGLQKQYSSLEQQLKSLDTQLIAIPQGNSAKVVSVTEAAEILELAKGNLRDTKILPLLLPPHDKRFKVSLLSTTNGTLDLLNPDGDPTAAPGSAPTAPASPQPAAPGMLGGAAGPDALRTMQGGGAAGPDHHGLATGLTQSAQVGSASLPVERYDYDLKITGTYPALMDVLNELVIRKKLVKINKVVISRPTEAEPQPNAKENPEFPVQLEMVVSLSMLLYPDNASQP
jgi:hypothetical protein